MSVTVWTAVKSVHVLSAALSITLFVLRGVWMLQRSGRLRRRWVRIVPHVVDTVLLASAVALAWMSRQYPLVEPWLTAKVAGLLVYIGLGLVALRFGRSRGVRLGAWLAAIAVFAYIIAVAVTRHPLPPL